MPIISGVTSAVLSKQAADYATDANILMNDANNRFNARQADLQRDWQAGQDAINRDFNATEAQKVRDYEERMSNTQYQRAFADAQAAGINPVAALLGNGGAGSPSVSAASYHSSGGSSANAGNFAGAKVPDFSGISHMSDGLASIASSAASLAAIKKLGTVKNVADVSKLLTSAKTAKSIAAIAKFLV